MATLDEQLAQLKQTVENENVSNIIKPTLTPTDATTLTIAPPIKKEKSFQSFFKKYGKYIVIAVMIAAVGLLFLKKKKKKKEKKMTADFPGTRDLHQPGRSLPPTTNASYAPPPPSTAQREENKDPNFTPLSRPRQ